ncbi:flavodoxin domain-containing protein [candidate division KSB1 bacterium]|nr:flavodoxin domain-containing protein [candidate division KSB1 bacterium]
MKVLIAYSSGYGTTKEVAERIGSILTQDAAIDAVVISVDDVAGIKEYDSVIVGSSVRADRPLANVRDFFHLHRKELESKKVAIFAVCLSANCQSGKEKVHREYLSQIIEKYPQINFMASAAFGGKIDFEKLNPVMQQLMYRVLEKTGLPTTGSVDTRDWDFIEAWSLEVKEKLLEQKK